MTKQYLFANWKMYLDYNESNILANALTNEAKTFPSSVVMSVFPSALALYPVGQVLRDAGIGVGAQNVYWVDKGGYTGEVSAEMYKAVGCEYALIGHSERRHIFHETNHDVRQKMEAALNAGLTPVLCVGETLAERENGKTDEVLEIQLRATFDDLLWPAQRSLIIAYEPVWAIGTDKACDPHEAMRIADKIRTLVHSLVADVTPIVLYGGSVKPDNIRDYIVDTELIDGVLVGVSSTKLDTWLDLVHSIR